MKPNLFQYGANQLICILVHKDINTQKAYKTLTSTLKRDQNSKPKSDIPLYPQSSLTNKNVIAYNVSIF